MADIIVVGSGPAGLTTVLFAVKNGLPTMVPDTGQAWMHKARPLNYPGVGSIDGPNYMGTLCTQVDHFDAGRHQGEEVTDMSENDDGFVVATDDDEHEADYAVLTTGVNRGLTESFGCAFDGDPTDVDVTMGASVENAYIAGAMVRVEEWQAAIPAGDGATVALNILPKEKDEHYHDFNVPADAESVFGSLIDGV